MDIVSINEKISKHTEQHSKGIAAYYMLKLLLLHLEERNIIDRTDINNITEALVTAFQQLADATNTEGNKHDAELWATVVSDFRKLTSSHS